MSVKKEKGIGSATDENGEFSLSTQKEAPITLRVGYTGYRAIEVDVYDFEEPIEISLLDNSNYLGEVVIVGYGVQ